ncbi:MerR family transcriptional regulator [Fusicatenibacter saccharivorans]|uniref:MerR family transcriptional regulator n=1 Tax=Fusicatenibacter saccharivorans TaxID=1150298 RepID=UPI0032C127FA
MRTIKEVSQLTGISIRTLRYYDEIGLLKPKRISENQYRLYDDKALEKLQEIMFFKEMDIPLGTIKKLLENPELDRKEILLFQKALLERKRNRLNGIIELIDDVREGVNTMSFEAFSEDDIEKIVEHTIKQMKPEQLQDFIQKFGSIEELSSALKEELKDEEIEANLIKLYGGKDKAVQASLSASGSMEEVQKFQKETDETYKMFAAAMLNRDNELKETAIKRLAESNKEMWHIENARYFLLQFAEQIEKNEQLIEATDKQYGVGVAMYMAEAIREHYGII